MYDFKIDVRKSRIREGGLGSFLTYLGGRVQKPEISITSERLLNDQIPHIPQTMIPIDALMEDGSNVSVNVTGKCIHGNQEVLFVPITKLPIHGVVFKGKKVSVCVRGDSLHENLEDMAEVKGKICDKNGLGHLKILTENDYIPDTGLAFSSYDEGCGLLDLGRYGPFLKSGKLHEKF